MIFPPQITVVRAAFVVSSNGVYPNITLSNQCIYAGFFWFYQPTNGILNSDIIYSDIINSPIINSDVIKCNLINVQKINDLSAIGGVYMLTSEASTTVFSGSLLPFNMLNNATFDGSLTFPSGLSICAYHLSFVGITTGSAAV